jgi:hypothetical protein
MIEKNHSEEGVESLARYSNCEKYRYTLTRTWDSSKSKIVFIGLNPSTATELKNDPTVTRMIHLAQRLNHGSATVCNLFAFRATFPEDLKKADNPVGKENDLWLQNEINSASKVIACWGNHGKFLSRSQEVLKFLKSYHHFGFTKQGEPRHILYLKSDAEIFSN